METGPAPPSSPVLLEELFDIPRQGYTTGSERLDGFIIGLATMLLIRNAEFVVIDLLTLLFGNRRQKVAFRVLRTWQMLNVVSIFSLLSGFDSDIPRSRLKSRARFLSFLPGFPRGPSFRTVKVNKGSFTTALFIAVLCAKLIVLSAEVAIIAFVIPSEKFHKFNGGMTLALRDTVVSEVHFQNLRTCHPMLNSTFLSDFAQLRLCRRFFTGSTVEPVPQRWLPNETIRIERTTIDPESVTEAGATLITMEETLLVCRERNETDSSSRRYMHDSREVTRQVSLIDAPQVVLVNNVNDGELAIAGSGSMLTASGFFQSVTVGMTTIFTDRQQMQRLSFENWFSRGSFDPSETVWTLNGKLLFGSLMRVGGSSTFEICAGAVDEIMRVTGTLNTEMILDMFLLSTEVERADSFSLPATDASEKTRLSGFEIGVSRKFPLSPIWIAVTAGVAVLLSAITATLNHTEAIMARTYREQNEMKGASSPVFLSEEKHVEAFLFRRGENYHWGKIPGEEWKEVEDIDFSEDAILT